MIFSSFKYFVIVLLLSITACKAQENTIVTTGAALTLVSEDFEFTEGPAMDSEGNIFFTDQPNDRIMKWNASNNTISTYLQPSGRSNGLYFDHDGNLLSCADAENELWRIDTKKKVTVLVADFEGRKLGGPNDLWVAPNGGIYFTDPLYQRTWWTHTEPQIKERRVYFMPPNTNKLQIVAKGFEQPNGIIGSADGKTLYLADNGAKKTYSFTINEDGSLSNKTLFTAMGSDGMTLDNQGNVYLTGDGVTVFDRTGKQIKHIDVPEKWTANVTFGGPDQNILFITAMDAVYTMAMNVHGVRY